MEDVVDFPVWGEFKFVGLPSIFERLPRMVCTALVLVLVSCCLAASDWLLLTRPLIRGEKV